MVQSNYATAATLKTLELINEMEKTINGINYEMQSTDSSTVLEFGHDKATNTLAIVFKYSPAIAYVYSNVSYQKHTPLNHAPSFGKHFHAKIRPFAEQYPFEKFAI